MSKKYIDPKITLVDINELRNQGLSNNEIFNQLSEVYYDKEELAKLIKFYRSDEKLKELSFEFKMLKGIFTFLLIANAIIFLDYFLGTNQIIYSKELSIIFRENSPFLMILVLASLYKHISPWTYYSLNFYSTLSIINSFTSLTNEEITFEIKIISFVINIILAITFFTFSYNIKTTLYPDIKFKDMFGIKKDNDGKFVL